MEELIAVVAGGVDYGDADRVVHLITGHGKVSVFAHGARRSRKRFAGALEPFTTIRASLEVRRGGRDGLRTMRSAVVENARLPLRSSLEKIALASYIVELASLVAPEGEASDALYALTVRALDHLLEHPATLLHRRRFELFLVDVLGYRPQLETCAVCSRAASPIYLDLAHGGVLCTDHRRHGYEIGPKTLAWMRSVYEGEGEHEVEWAEVAAKKLSAGTAQFFSGLIGRRVKSLDMLDGLGL